MRADRKGKVNDCTLNYDGGNGYFTVPLLKTSEGELCLRGHTWTPSAACRIRPWALLCEHIFTELPNGAHSVTVHPKLTAMNIPAEENQQAPGREHSPQKSELSLGSSCFIPGSGKGQNTSMREKALSIRAEL